MGEKWLWSTLHYITINVIVLIHAVSLHKVINEN